MKAAFAHMGHIDVNLGAWVRHLGIELQQPPKPTMQSLAAGVRHSPEQICIPFKANLGDQIAALESGVDLLVSVQGAWSCRFGYYGRLQHAILRDLGYRFETLVLDGSRENIAQVTRIIKAANGVRSTAAAAKIFVDAFRIAYKKGKLLARAQDEARRLRPLALQTGAVERVFARLVAQIDEAESHASLDRVGRAIDPAFAEIPVERERPVVRLMILGEVYIVLEPLANMQAERRLGELGAWVDTFVNEHRWVIHPFRLGVYGRYQERHAQRLATPYLKHKLGGEDKNTLGFTIIAARRGFDGVVHFKPFTCMPEGVAKHILYAVSRDHGIPFVSFTVDEHSAEAGFVTRLEAFTDMLHQQRERGSAALAAAG